MKRKRNWYDSCFFCIRENEISKMSVITLFANTCPQSIIKTLEQPPKLLNVFSLLLNPNRQKRKNPIEHIRGSFSAKLNKQLKVVNYFCKKAPSQMIDLVLNSLSGIRTQGNYQKYEAMSKNKRNLLSPGIQFSST